MNKKIDTSELSVPIDDIDCWMRYPKHRWVYDLSRLLDAQNIYWSPFEIPGLERELNMHLYSVELLVRQPGFIYLKKTNKSFMLTEAYIIKGEVKLLRHIDSTTKKELSQLLGDIELIINAFISLHFTKFTGVLSIKTYGKEIHEISLRPLSDLGQENNIEVIKLIKKIYKKQNVTINGLTDQTLHTTLAS